MLKDFETIKIQLEQLAPLINAFTSEADAETRRRSSVRRHGSLLRQGEAEEVFRIRCPAPERTVGQELWDKRDYETLMLAAGDEGGRLREPRFVMQARTAHETRNMARVTAVLAGATALLATGTLIVELAKFLGGVC
jgi:hypothetical protein